MKAQQYVFRFFCVFTFLLCLTLVSKPTKATDSNEEDLHKHVQGILALPILCWNKCEGSHIPLMVYDEPSFDLEPLHIIRQKDLLKPHPDFPENEGYNVRLYDSPLFPKTAEYDYEELGALVYESRGKWHKIRLKDKDVWTYELTPITFHAYPEMLKDNLSYLDKWDFQLWESPEANTPKIIDHSLIYHDPHSSDISINVLDIAHTEDNVWMKVNIHNQSPCEAEKEPDIVSTGWVKAYKTNGTPRAWFYSRGC